MTTIQALRQSLRARRRALSKADQQVAAQKLAQLVSQTAIFQQSQKIGYYLANDGEIDPLPLIQHCWQLGKNCYLPVIKIAKRSLRFAPFQSDTKLYANRYGIAEPRVDASALVSVAELDLLCLPLVGFDRQGARLGMGGGYYDRALAFKQQQPQQKPFLLGLGHSVQQVDRLEMQPWDIKLDAVATEAFSLDYAPLGLIQPTKLGLIQLQIYT